jgi:hypothetical protein
LAGAHVGRAGCRRERTDAQLVGYSRQRQGAVYQVPHFETEKETA